MKNFTLKRWIVSAVALAGLVSAAKAEPGDNFEFRMVKNAGATCVVSTAHARVNISDLGPVQNLHIEISDLPANTEYTVFMLQVPHAPFGLVWYQGDIVTNKWGRGVGDFTGIFSKETFINGPGVAPAPVIFPDNAPWNPQTQPIQIYHMGVWFADPADATKAGCPGTVTPFDGDHEAGIQVLNTTNFPDKAGPLLKLQ